MAGATGTAGRATAMALRDAGHAVLALGRRDPNLPGIDFQQADMMDTGQLAASLRTAGVDGVVSCIASRTGAPADAWATDHDANLALLRAAQDAGVGQFILLSAICVQKPRLAFQHAKRAFEDRLIGSGLRYGIVRPTAFFKSLSGQVERVRQGKPYLLFGRGDLTACKPISNRDLGAYIVRCLDDPALADRVLPIGGPGPALTPRDMGAALFKLAGMPPRYRSVPPFLLRGVARGLDLGGRFTPRLGAKAEFARIGHYYATESMLVWNAAEGRYDADATPETGQDRLFDHFAALLAGRALPERGDHAVF
ncbi:epimerase [Sulfitobacter alexandrii]|uniref:Divinyl chlorophyllide a 8-vinyl-reductase, chloroplastic n=1 Tax=Sulfitobacter alexandrii TaxID=1917485 RepID=A0A1J0WLZ4_9RHOB|nr:epimerase [Sulfitobacter alexandrii]